MVVVACGHQEGERPFASTKGIKVLNSLPQRGIDDEICWARFRVLQEHPRHPWRKQLKTGVDRCQARRLGGQTLLLTAAFPPTELGVTTKAGANAHQGEGGNTYSSIPESRGLRAPLGVSERPG